MPANLNDLLDAMAARDQRHVVMRYESREEPPFASAYLYPADDPAEKLLLDFPANLRATDAHTARSRMQEQVSQHYEMVKKRLLEEGFTVTVEG